MRPWTYRLIVIGTALAWFMVGLHAPMLHYIMDHGEQVSRPTLLIVAILVIAAVAALWALLRAPRRWTSGAS